MYGRVKESVLYIKFKCMVINMDLNELVVRFHDIKYNYLIVDTRFRGINDVVYGLMKDIANVATKISMLATRIAGNIELQLKDNYVSISPDGIMMCHRSSCFKLTGINLEIMQKLKDNSNFIFAKEMKELLDIYDTLGRIDHSSYTFDFNCEVYVDPSRIGVLKRVEALSYDFRLIIEINGKQSIYKLDDYIALSIAYNCYEDFMNAINDLLKRYESLYMQLRKYREKIEEYEKFIELYETLGGIDDH